MGDASSNIASNPSPAALTWRGGVIRVLLACVIYAAMATSYRFIESPFVRAVSWVSDVLLHSPGFNVEAKFRAQPGALIDDFTVEVHHLPSGMSALNRLDVRFRLWLPLGCFVALVAATPAPARRKFGVLLLGLLALAALALVSSYLVALYPLISGPDNVLGLATAPRVAFNVAYSAIVLSNPSAALFPVLFWGFIMRANIGGALGVRYAPE